MSDRATETREFIRAMIRSQIDGGSSLDTPEGWHRLAVWVALGCLTSDDGLDGDAGLVSAVRSAVDAARSCGPEPPV